MVTEHIFRALCETPQFLNDLPEADAFDRTGLSLPDVCEPLSMAQKLGHLYEDGLRVLLEQSKQYELLEHGLQLQEGRHKTRGELDFLFRDHNSGELIHLELAVKFYLAIEGPVGLLLPGPNSRDNYYNKLERLRSHQLTLTQRFAHLLPAVYQAESISVKHLVIGRLFDHVTAASQAQPKYLNPGAQRGVWLRQSEYPAHFLHQESLLEIPKPLWPVDLAAIPDEELSPFDLKAPLTRCTLVKVPQLDYPVFLAPDIYPQQ